MRLPDLSETGWNGIFTAAIAKSAGRARSNLSLCLHNLHSLSFVSPSRASLRRSDHARRPYERRKPPETQKPSRKIRKLRRAQKLCDKNTDHKNCAPDTLVDFHTGIDKFHYHEPH